MGRNTSGNLRTPIELMMKNISFLILDKIIADTTAPIISIELDRVISEQFIQLHILPNSLDEMQKESAALVSYRRQSSIVLYKNTTNLKQENVSLEISFLFYFMINNAKTFSLSSVSLISLSIPRAHSSTSLKNCLQVQLSALNVPESSSNPRSWIHKLYWTESLNFRSYRSELSSLEFNRRCL